MAIRKNPVQIMARITLVTEIVWLLLLTCGPNFSSAASGGRMGGSFFESPPSIPSDSVRRNHAKADDSVPPDYVPPPPAKTYSPVHQSYDYYPSAPPEPYNSDPPTYVPPPPKTNNYVPPPAKTNNYVPPPRKTNNYVPPPAKTDSGKTYYSSVHNSYIYYPSEPCFGFTPKNYNCARRNNVAPPSDYNDVPSHAKINNNSSSVGNNDHVKYNANVLVFFTIIFASILVCLVLCAHSAPADKTTVLKLQVGLLDLRKSVQKELNEIAETADTSTRKGLHYILTETVLALLWHTDRCVFTYSSADVKRSKLEGERIFNQLATEERSKFDTETLVNVNNIKKNRSSTLFRASGSSNEYIVITILVAVGGAHKLPCINNIKDLKEALKKHLFTSTRTMALEVLWTPQEEDDTLSELELHQDYPLLRPLKDGINWS